MKTCSKCKVDKNVSDFFTRDKSTGRLHAQCKSCYKEHRKIYQKEHYKKYQLEYLKRAQVYRKKLRDEFRMNLIQYLSGKKCALCNENDIRTFEFDHIDPSNKKFNISQSVRLGYEWEQTLDEIEKCRILCANCHKKHTALQQNWYKNI